MIEGRRAITVVYVLGLFMTIVDVTIVNVALPQIGRQLAVGTAQLGAVSVAYTVALAAVIPVSGWLGDRWGGAPVLLTAVGVFTGASALCGSATGFPELVAFRAVQGAAGGLLTPVGLAMLFRAYPAAERIRVTGRTAVVTGLAPVLGPVLGGVLVTNLSWRWVFFVNVPVGAAALIYGALFLRRQDVVHPGRLDVTGLALSGGGLAAAMYGLSEGPELGWSGLPVVVALVAGVALLAVFVVVELRIADPLLRLRLFAQSRFRVVNVATFLGTASFFGLLYLIAIYLQQVLGLSAQLAGLLMIAEAATVLLGAQAASRVLYPRLGPRPLLVAGPAGLVTAAVLMAISVGTHRVALWAALLALLGASWSMVFLPATAAAFDEVTERDTAQASTLFSTTRQLGSAVGVAALAAAFAGPAGSADGDAFRIPFLVAAGFAATASVGAARLRVTLQR